MLLKFLDIQGFKSFPDKTRVSFGRGMTAVVGPNGSGKSNISDAVRWVLGEQSTKTLRGEKMEDVIFSGTQTRKSQGFAEVSLTVDNADRELGVDMDEVTITRRYDRSGESEYMINRSPVRLKDVHELLMDTGLGRDGYSLIGQGKIAEIIQSKSGERREVFEEAAGISKFRYRRAESERSLARAEENLVRLRDILAELEARVGPLKEQSAKAKRFLELSEQRKRLEVSLWIATIEKSNQAVKDESDRLVALQEKQTAAEERAQGMEDRIQAAFGGMQALLLESESLRRKKASLEEEIAQANAEIAVCGNDIFHHEQDIARLDGEIEGQAKSADSTAARMEEKRVQLEELETKLVWLRDSILQKQGDLTGQLAESEGLTQRERDLAGRMNELIAAQSTARLTAVSAGRSADELAQTIAENEETRRRREEELAGIRAELAEADAFLAELAERAEGLQNTARGHRLKLETRVETLAAAKRELEKTDLARKEKEQKRRLLEGMEQSLEGYAFSVREVLGRAKHGALPGVRGTVSQLLNVEEEYATAIETAVGGAMQNLVVDDEGAAKAAIRLLQQNNLGRATFLPLSAVRGSVLAEPGLDRYAGFVDLAVNLVRFDEDYRGVMNSLLGRIVIVDDLDTAVSIAQKYGYKFKLVTLDGQVVNAGGSMTGGSKGKSPGFLSRRNEIRSLQSEAAALAEALARQTAAVEERQAEAARIEAELTAVQAELQTAGEDRIRAEGEQKRLAQLAAQGGELLGAMERELVEKRQKLAALRQSAGEASESLAGFDAETAALADELADLQTSNRSYAEARAALGEELNALRLEELTQEKDIEAIKTAIAALQEQRLSAGGAAQRLEADKAEFTRRIAEIRVHIGELHAAIGEKRAAADGIDGAVREALQKRQELEGESTQLRQEARAAQADKEQLAQELVRAEERRGQIQREFDQLNDKLWEEYELTRSEAAAIAEPLEDPRAAQSELNGLRNKIRGLGSVNVAAIEEYEEVRQRYEFLGRQIADAEQSKKELLRLIGDLTQRMQTIFAENFEKIDTQFRRIFAELFGGGQAELRLSDPDDLLEAGIDIHVEPPGKIVKNLSALSGGEQAFVAIAIYFAILTVHPAPFCILDEIEAALDDVNVDKYAAYLKGMCDRTQFICITHRRGTMEASDILYGVTMQEDGVSKLLQLKVSEIEEKLPATRREAR